MSNQRVAISAGQARLLHRAQQEVEWAQQQLNLVATVILAGHDLDGDSRIVSLEPDRVIVVQTADTKG